MIYYENIRNVQISYVIQATNVHLVFKYSKILYFSTQY